MSLAACLTNWTNVALVFTDAMYISRVAEALRQQQQAG